MHTVIASRWRGKLVAGILVWGAALLLWAPALRAQSLADRLTPLISGHKGKVAVVAMHLASGESFAHEADRPMPTASLIKVAIMVEAYRQAEAGTLDLAQPIALRAEDKVPGSGILTTHFSPGATIALRDVIRLMIAYSDNTATNLVLEKIGLPATAQAMESLGMPNTKVHSYVFKRESSVFPERSREFGLGSTTAAESARLLAELHAKKLVTPAACGEMLAHLRACEDRRIPKLLPAGTKVAHKTGSVAAVRTAAGIIEAPSGPIVLCVLTSDNEDQRWTAENAGEVLTSEIAKAVYDHFETKAAKSAATAVAEVLKLGASGPLVQAVQRTLNARHEPSPELAIDGDYGPATESAVKAFQEAKGLAVTGEVGPETFRALGPLVEADAVPDPAEINAAVLPQSPREPLDGPPAVTCKAWAIADLKSGDVLAEHGASAKLDIASTTKMMTAYLVCRLASADPRVLDEIVTFSEPADKTVGSTADLRAGEQVSVRELLYGLMLPSGNDAATAFAEHFGPRLAEQATAKGAAAGGDSEAPRSSTADFVDAMNRTAAELGMADTNYANPHGLTAREHKSSAADLVRLARATLALPLFREVVSTRQRGATVTGTGGYRRNVLWKNTNRLLGTEGFLGVKTGTTDAAGACLVACEERDGRELVVVILGATSSDARYVDARNLFRWAWTEKN
jgi:D-alanyl-D-alanine carboxypeptidase (penicillin-binding protein 5/6)